MRQSHHTEKLTKPVTRAEFEAMRQRIEDMEDRFDLLQAHTRGPSEDAWPDSFAKRLVNGENPLRLWREFRGMTLDQLSTTANVSKSYLSEVENNIKGGSVAFLKACAKALNISLEDITG